MTCPTAGRSLLIRTSSSYHFTGASQQCSRLLGRAASAEVELWTGAHLIAEVMHRLLVLEAQERGLVSGGNPARKLKAQPDHVKSLTRYQVQADLAMQWLTRVVPLRSEVLEMSGPVRASHGLLANDSLTIAMMEADAVRCLVTADRDFGRLASIEVYSPSDLTP
jgi:predicted nucleic acid-binding protein